MIQSCKYALAATLMLASLSTGAKQRVTMETLLDEMVSVEEQSRRPSPAYTARQESSYDRGSVSPDHQGWFANNDGFGIIRTDTVDGRVERVMFDQTGPGAITRIWITTLDTRGTWRFYFDGAETPGWVIPAYDLMKAGLPNAEGALIIPHTSYKPEGRGGNTSFLPIPYAQSCKITFEDEAGINATPKYYHINYRKYPADVEVETFSPQVLDRAAGRIKEVNDNLLHPSVALRKGERKLETSAVMKPGDSVTLSLPKGNNAVYALSFAVTPNDASAYADVMRRLILTADFDGKETVMVPLSDFSGGGIGAPKVSSWFLDSDGKGNVTSRWLMPYRRTGAITLRNISDESVDVAITATVAPLKWNKRSLYFHASWKRQDSIYIHNRPEEQDRCLDWNFARLQGYGIYKGDVLTLYNHAPRWYGEGDEKIWVDGDTFPSHFGTGTEDYYNSSWAPVYPFHTPFGGAPRADEGSSHGYNTFFRTRNLDGIPFERDFRFDIEMLGWDPGVADYATTIYWYGDADAKALGTSSAAEAGVPQPVKAD